MYEKIKKKRIMIGNKLGFLIARDNKECIFFVIVRKNFGIFKGTELKVDT